ncbi:PREDICTED: tyrosine-protein phosphatase 99A-like, partial [Rhagoletis zephyria]|uniref:tyrosine-protein phosphatase 99A-like n=1 Tax=Rhagoletis zephyria TaxID=28612 RepID=UPI00081155C0
MPRPRSAARLRLLLNLLLFAAIISEHRSVAAGIAIDPELSSPSPFTIASTASTPIPTPTSKYSATVASERDNDSFSSISSSSSGSDSGGRIITPASYALDLNAYAVNGVSMDSNDVPTAVAGVGATDETDIDYQLHAVVPTSPASVEQQDQPLVPPTTLSFANIAPASGMGGGELFSGGSISGFDLGEGDGETATTASDATPPYAAVDDKYVPSKPLNLTVLNVTSSSITMSWYPPKNQNGAIAGYHVFHIHENQTGVEIMKNSRNSLDTIIIFELPNLKPFTDYRVIVQAFTMKNEGNPSDQIVQRTDVAGPNAPYVVNLTCHSQDAIAIRWRRPHEFYNTIDFYIIKTRVVGQDSHRDIRINASAKELETAMILQNLTTHTEYEVKVAAATLSIINPKKIVLGKFSETRKISLHPNCEKIQPLLRQSHNDYNLAVLVGIIFSCFGIVLIVMAFFLW